MSSRDDFLVQQLWIGTGLEFINIFDEILSMQQEKSSVQMNQLCTINTSRATAIACSLAVPNISMR